MTELRVSWKAIKWQIVFSMLGFAIGIFLILSSMQEFIDIPLFSFGAIFLAIGLGLVYHLALFPKYWLSNEQLMVKTLFGTTTINIAEVTEASYFEYRKKIKMLTIRYKGKELGISSGQTKDFELLLDVFKESVSEDVKGKNIFGRVIWMAVFTIIFPVFLVGLFLISSDKTQPKSANDLLEHIIILDDEPTATGQEPNLGYKFSSVLEPRFSYLISDSFLKPSTIDKLQKGDTLTIYVNKYDKRVKLDQTRRPKWVDRHLNWPVIRVYGINRGEIQLVKPEATLKK